MAKPGPIQQSNEQSSRYAALLVSFYLVLLTFFVFLNALAVPSKQRQDQVVESVQQSFTQIIAYGSVREIPKENATERDIDDFFALLELLLEPLTKQQDVTISRDDTHYRIQMPTHLFFSEGSAAPTLLAENSMNELSRILLQWSDLLAIETSLVTGMDRGGNHVNPQKIAIQRVGNWATRMETRLELNSPPSAGTPLQLATGYDAGLRERTELIFKAAYRENMEDVK